MTRAAHAEQYAVRRIKTLKQPVLERHWATRAAYRGAIELRVSSVGHANVARRIKAKDTCSSAALDHDA